MISTISKFSKLNRTNFLGQQLLYCQARNFAIYTPQSKLYFIDHPRYGKVYPIVSYNFDKNYFKLPCATAIGHACLNSVFLYGTFITPIFTPLVMSYICNPLFLLPSLYMNYATLKKYYIFFFGARSHI